MHVIDGGAQSDGFAHVSSGDVGFVKGVHGLVLGTDL